MNSKLNGKLWEAAKIVLIIVGTVLTMLATVGNRIDGQVEREVAKETKPIAADVEVLKATQQLDRQSVTARLNRIEAKLDRLLERTAQ